MLRKFSVRNFKNFKETLVLDLGKVGGYKFNPECIADNTVSKCIIYGRNATGKTNLGEAIGDIFDILFGVPQRMRNDRFLNADSDEPVAEFTYEFAFGEDRIVYTYQRNNRHELVSETLCLNDNSIYKMNFEKSDLSDTNLELIGAETIQLKKYTDAMEPVLADIEGETDTQVPFLRYILNNAPLLPDNVLRSMEDYIKRMRHISVSLIKRSRLNPAFNDYLADTRNLEQFQEFLNVMGIECELEVAKSPDGQNELFFKHETLVPFYENASSGTLSLLTLYRRIMVFDKTPSFLYMDEFDAYYNYEMSEKIVKFLKSNFPKCQVVLTTHNTNLMTNQLMRPDCLFILSGTGKLTALCDATERELREGHNLEKLYIGGEFEQYE